MAEKLIAKSWGEFETKVLRFAPPAAKREMKKAYYCGALALFTNILAAMNHDTEEPTPEDEAVMNSIADELQEFEMEIMKSLVS